MQRPSPEVSVSTPVRAVSIQSTTISAPPTGLRQTAVVTGKTAQTASSLEVAAAPSRTAGEAAPISSALISPSAKADALHVISVRFARSGYASPQQTPTLIEIEPDQMGLLSSEEFRERLLATPRDALAPEQLSSIEGDERLNQIARLLFSDTTTDTPDAKDIE
jgi:hypothetical protein